MNAPHLIAVPRPNPPITPREAAIQCACFAGLVALAFVFWFGVYSLGVVLARSVGGAW